MVRNRVRASLVQVLHEINAYKELNVRFIINEADSTVIVKAPLPHMEAASQFRNNYENEIRLATLAGDDTRWLLALEFQRWRADQEEWGPNPGQRVIRYSRMKEGDDDE